MCTALQWATCAMVILASYSQSTLRSQNMRTKYLVSSVSLSPLRYVHVLCNFLCCFVCTLVSGFQGSFEGPVVAMINRYCDSTCEGIAMGELTVLENKERAAGMQGCRDAGRQAGRDGEVCVVTVNITGASRGS
eukprot:COSAG02_NODE_4860_length_4893_cov_3.597205_2_plen_134_part_00